MKGIVKEAFRRFGVKLIYRLIWLIFIALLFIGIALLFGGRASASYDAYNSTSPPSNTYLNAFVADDCDYVIFYSAEDILIAVKGDLSYEGNVITGVDVTACQYNSGYNNRSYNRFVISDFSLIVDNSDLIYSNLGDFADIRGGRLDEGNSNKIIFAVAFGCGLMLLYFVTKHIISGR